MEYFAAGLRVVGQTADGGRNGEVWMKSFLLRYFDRLTLRAARQILTFLRGYYDFDVFEIARLKAALDSAAYYETHLIHARMIESRLELLSHAISLAPSDCLILEFGVASGRTIRHLAE